MIYSMTAFARVENQEPGTHLTCEIRSVNHRFLEIGVHLPESFKALEIAIRECIREHIKRGKVECGIRYHRSASVSQNLFTVNETLAKELCLASERISAFLAQPAAISATEIMRFPGILETVEENQKELQQHVLRLVEKTLHELLAVREREGRELTQLFLNRIGLMQSELNKVKNHFPEISLEARERLKKRFLDAKLELDPNRLEQEMLIFAQKIDVSEEIERTETHLQEVQRVLKQGGAVGRRLDFLLQELNREANTLGSKSVNPVLTHAAVEMKVLIEQIREQVQNVE